jgi:hypothetical protein
MMVAMAISCVQHVSMIVSPYTTLPPPATSHIPINARGGESGEKKALFAKSPLP